LQQEFLVLVGYAQIGYCMWRKEKITKYAIMLIYEIPFLKIIITVSFKKKQLLLKV